MLADSSYCDALDLVPRDDKPRRRGRTMVIDTGTPTRWFEDVVESHGDLVDSVKFGWGTCLVTRDIKTKIDVCRAAGVEAYFGGTLFERFAAAGAVTDWQELCRATGCTTVEISNGTIPMSDTEKADWVARMAQEFTVISEVGFKDGGRSMALSPTEWVAAVWSDLQAGATTVTLEARESGRSGFCTPDGEAREDVLGALDASGLDRDRLLFEAPTRDLQVRLLRRYGAGVNLGNVALTDVVGLETLRLGLRADTFGGV
ncbi:phosphosulfolactate synthase [Actinomycetospora sp. TBRC 11914]|uniref:phosphosulfolactate synthase n=1 Tax=Actinomycetospora sp. TBRC 11914 TaxID=2729387 RepID=UPI00145D25EF|nr:phosphosulfolactate synthase [Actinomycetospora sp. TBRC 11914]NMO92439.1 phosphosulfolactate synthase [Actinomycetospora sp. TBRC 11914]